MECKNCQHTEAEAFDFCPSCGAKVIHNRLTFKNLSVDIAERVFDIDNTFLKTFLHLLSQPEIVIDGYIQGIRKRYINPISYFAFALTLAGLQIFLVKKFFSNAYDFSSIAASGQEEFMSTMMNSIQEYSSLITMLMIPVYALMARIVFINIKKYNYTELVVVFLYFAAEVSFISFIPFMVLIALGFNYGQLSPVATVLQILIAAYYLKRLYALSTKGIILRTLFFLVILTMFYIVAILITLVLMFVFGILPLPEA
jgi:hypothetical protein